MAGNPDPAAGPESLPDLGHRARQGDEDAFLALYDRLARGLYGTALRLLGNREEAEDAVQDALLRFIRQPGPPPDDPGAWLRRVTANAAIDRLRRRRRWREEQLDEAAAGFAPARSTGGGAGAPADLAVDLERALARLPERARAVFILHDVDGLTHEELAALLRIDPGTSKSQLFRAREILRGWLGGGPAQPAPAATGKRTRP